MSKIKKLILVTAEYHPLHKYFTTLAERVAKEFGVETEVKYEDYIFLIEHGDTDELGMAWIPQLLAELSDGNVVLLLSKAPFDADLKPDLEKGYEEIMNRIRTSPSG
ncbi:MAG: hypothetical protein RMH77_07060 [Sulfolobales archaeon]|nr:hypothetical protein [Sulfolobales archaeon]MCX8185767.1 hypothetical protein [Sulfolobales archaeon]MDW7970137.1 hypothetical protein [Sulfolobales archaeon]